VLGPPDPTALARIVDPRGETVAWGTYSPDSDIVVRVLGFGSAPPRDRWLDLRIEAALASRRRIGLGDETTGYREVNSEGDGLPGLVVDRYENVRVVQLTTAHFAARRDELTHLLSADVDDVICVVPAGAAKHEGLEPAHFGPRLDALGFRECGLGFACPAPPTQKTGAYFDQRENRRTAARLAASTGGRLLDLGCHVGGFSAHAAALGVDCVAVDESETALAFAAKNVAGLPASVSFVRANMFGPLDHDALAGPFGVIVIDPPKMASSSRDQKRALTALRQLVGQLAPRVAPAGFLVLCSCSHHIGAQDLDEVASRASDRPLSRVMALGPGPDHPTALGHEAGEYLRAQIYQPP
jgi:23S rRNA (cytosine1962-C5)-methyltransferase